MSEWISVEVKLPELNQRVLVWEKDNITIAFISQEFHIQTGALTFFQASDTWIPVPVTHWQPLPSPPEENLLTEAAV